MSKENYWFKIQYLPATPFTKKPKQHKPSPKTGAQNCTLYMLAELGLITESHKKAGFLYADLYQKNILGRPNGSQVNFKHPYHAFFPFYPPDFSAKYYALWRTEFSQHQNFAIWALLQKIILENMLTLIPLIQKNKRLGRTLKHAFDALAKVVS